MKRPILKDYTTRTSYLGALEKYCDYLEAQQAKKPKSTKKK